MVVEEVHGTSRASLIQVLRNRGFSRLWAAQAISLTAQAMVNFAVIVLTERVTQRSLFTSLAILSFVIPPVLVGAFAGVVVDRSNKPFMLWITNLLRTGLMIGYFLFDRDWSPVVLLSGIFLITALFAAVSQFFGPAEAATIPLLVPRHQLLAANALFATTYNASLVVGMAILGPLLVTLLGLRRLWLFIAVLYGLCTILVARLPSGDRSQERPLRAILRESTDGLAATLYREFWLPVREGWSFMANHPPVRAATINLSLASTILLVVATLGPGFVSRVLGRNPEDVSFLLLPASLGMILGIVLVGRVVRRTGPSRLISLSMVGGALCLAGLALSPTWGVSLAHLFGGAAAPANLIGDVILGGAVVMAVGLGVVNSFITVPAYTQLQEETDESMRGRVFASLFMITGTLSMLPVLFAGALADWLGLITVMVIVAVIMGAAGFVTMGRRSQTSPPRAHADAPPGA
jgi:MFS family permease